MNRNVAVDILKLVLAFMVVGIHAGFLREAGPFAQYVAVNGLFRIAVPIFFIINGFYFFTVVQDKRQTAWLQRALLLYAFWMAFYSFAWLEVSNLSVAASAKLAVVMIFGYHHLWYVPGMIGAAVILLLVRNASLRILAASVALTFLAGVFIQYSGNYHLFRGSIFDKLFNSNGVHRNWLFLAYPFFCIGCLTRKYSLHQRISWSVALALSSIGVILLVVEACFNYCNENADGGFDNLFSLIIACPFIFIAVIKTSLVGNSKNVALCASAVYFFHVAILMMLRDYLGGSVLTVAVFAASVVGSFFIIKANRRLGCIL